MARSSIEHFVRATFPLGSRLGKCQAEVTIESLPKERFLLGRAAKDGKGDQRNWPK